MTPSRNHAASIRSRTSPRRGEGDSKTIIIVILAIVGGLMLLACVGVVGLGIMGYRQAAMVSGQAGNQMSSRNNLKQIGLGLHNYHDVHRQFPPGGIYGEDGTAYHSWQAMLLPYVDQAPAYNQIDFNRPWDDPANSGLFDVEVYPYLNPTISESPYDARGFALSHYAGNSRFFQENQGMMIRDIRDGTSNTIMAGEVAAGFKPWGDPTNLRDPASGLGAGPDTFSGPGPQQVTQFLLGDGSVRSVTATVNPDVLEALATPDGGEPVPEF